MLKFCCDVSEDPCQAQMVMWGGGGGVGVGVVDRGGYKFATLGSSIVHTCQRITRGGGC